MQPLDWINKLDIQFHYTVIVSEHLAYTNSGLSPVTTKEVYL